MPRLRTRSKRGFSLIELLLVLAIVSVLAAMAVPRYREAVSRYELDLAAHRLVQDLHFARDRARLTGQRHSVDFSISENQYELPEVSDPDHPEEEYRVHLGDKLNGVRISGVSFNGGGVVEFNGFGLPDYAGKIVLQYDGSQKTVVLDGETGEALVQ